MKIKLLISRVRADGAQNAGDEIEVTNDEARRMIDMGQAVAVREKRHERADKPAQAEKAVK